MKKYIFTLFLIVAATGISMQAHGQAPDYLGLPGDNLNLFAVMKLFQESPTLEDFERNLNNEDMRINNLDLDLDGRIDYIRVIDNVDGSYHAIVLQDALSPRDIQDVAVFIVQRDRRGRVSIQLTGDEALYGRDYIVEPNYADLDYNETPNPGYYNNGETVVVRTTTYEVAAWPVIRFIYMPAYVVWHSPWYYNYYPSYWHSWHPYYWHYYYGYHYNWDPYYYGHYRVYNYHRHDYWHNTYYSHRHYVPSVTSRIESGSYRKTYSRPEARRAGYDMYYKKHPEENARRSTNTIADPVARTRNQPVNDSRQRSANTTTNGRRTLGESRSTTQSNGTVQTNTRTRTSSTSNGSKVGTTNQTSGGRHLSNSTSVKTRSQAETQTRTQTQAQQRTTERSAGTRSNGADQKKSTTRTQTERRSSEANTAGTSKKPVEKKESNNTTTQKTRGERRTAN